MKKKLMSLLVVFTLVFASLAGVYVPKTSSAAETAVTYEKKSVSAFLFAADKQKTLDVYFRSDLPEVPYVDLVDYLSVLTVNKITENGSNGIVNVENNGGTLTVDTIKDTISSENYEKFSNMDTDKEGTSDDNMPLQDVTATLPAFSLKIDFSKYGIDLIERDGKAYFPLPTLNDFYISFYRGCLYAEGKLYFYNSKDDMGNDPTYFEDVKKSLITRMENSADFQKYYYNEFCFCIDNVYGRPSKAKIATSIAEKGLDKTLDTYDTVTPIIKAKLQSTNRFDNALGMIALEAYFDDGGHTQLGCGYLLDGLQNYPDTDFGKAMKAFIGGINPEDPFQKTIVNGLAAMGTIGVYSEELKTAKNTALSKYKLLKEWDTGHALYVKGDTAMFCFDSFIKESMYAFKEALDISKKKGIKKFVIDLGTNGGGLTVSAYFMLVIMNNSVNNAHENQFTVHNRNVITESVEESIEQFDLNLDGKFDDADKDVRYDFQFAILTSCKSFSSANILPCLSTELGIPVVGERSGGGTCMETLPRLSDFVLNFMSGPSTFLYSDGKTDMDQGAPLSAELVKVNEEGTKDYSAMYDINVLNKTLDSLKSPNTMTVKAGTKTVKALKLKKANVTIKNAIKVKKAKGAVTYTCKSSSVKTVSVSKKGVITLKKGTYKKGTVIKVKVLVKAEGDVKFAPAAKTVTVRIKIK